MGFLRRFYKDHPSPTNPAKDHVQERARSHDETCALVITRGRACRDVSKLPRSSRRSSAGHVSENVRNPRPRRPSGVRKHDVYTRRKPRHIDDVFFFPFVWTRFQAVTVGTDKRGIGTCRRISTVSVRLPLKKTI